MKMRSQVELLRKINFPSFPTGVEPMTLQDTGWTLWLLSYGGLMTSKVYVLMCDTCPANCKAQVCRNYKCRYMISEIVTWIKWNKWRTLLRVKLKYALKPRWALCLHVLRKFDTYIAWFVRKCELCSSTYNRWGIMADSTLRQYVPSNA